MTPPAPKPRMSLAAAVAFAMGVATGGTMPPIVTHGDAPADAAGWTCEAVGPALNAQLVCRFEEEGWGQNADAFASPDDCGWETRVIDGIRVSTPVPCASGHRAPLGAPLDAGTPADAGAAP